MNICNTTELVSVFPAFKELLKEGRRRSKGKKGEQRVRKGGGKKGMETVAGRRVREEGREGKGMGHGKMFHPKKVEFFSGFAV